MGVWRLETSRLWKMKSRRLRMDVIFNGSYNTLHLEITDKKSKLWRKYGLEGSSNEGVEDFYMQQISS